ncbi:ammonium transporter Rh type B [Coregonus clupeaformis]|uniref:ammonium transporter Rh type B n=1 Tax=Coregonus clupeaformis TaxID=59861 RepID=UPI001BDFE5AE|nr:ammonium transporter Rh type B [Coregonus clupeaformis]
MAPQNAPSLRSRLPPLLFFLQTGFIVVFIFYVEIEQNVETKQHAFTNYYSEFQDVHVMVILGFGFLATFLVRYSFSGAGFTLLVAAMAVQWAVILNGVESLYHRGKIWINMRSLVVAEMCTASSLIAIGAILGKTNPVHLLLIALLEVSGFVLNGWLLQTFLKVQFLNTIMLLHIFGTFFGLMLSWVLYQPGSEQQHEKEKIDRKTGLFSVMGTLFLWMFWPSFNSVLVEVDHPDRGRNLRAVYSTYLALAVSAVTAAGFSVLTSPQGKLNLFHIQRCTLAGGVAIGVAMSAVNLPWVAMAVGFAAALISTLGSRYIKPLMLFAFECHDTCGVLSVHGLPGILGWMVQLLLQIADSDDLTTAVRFAVFHICTLLITLSLSMILGLITGFLLKCNFWRPPQKKKCFDDQAYWEFPHLVVKQ